MITKQDALQIAKAILQAKAREENTFKTFSQYAVEATNSVTYNSLQNLWYDVFSSKLKEKFNYSCEEFVQEVYKSMKA
jgi:hypothetical protein